MDRVTFGGTELSAAYLVTNVVRNMPTIAPELSLRDGAYTIVNIEKTPPTISFTVISGHIGQEGRRAMARELAKALMVDDWVDVYFNSDDDLHYRAIPTATLVFSELIRTGKLDVQMQCDSVAMYGEAKSITVPSGGSALFIVGGTYKTLPKIEALAAVRSTSSNVWGLVLDNSDAIKVPTGSNSARSVSVDCGTRESRVQGSVVLPTIDSDWLELEPGAHTIRNDHGSGSATVSWVERWL